MFKGLAATLAFLTLTVACGSRDEGPSPTFNQPRPAWLQEGIIDAGGTHEPYIYMVRRGGLSLRTDQREIYLSQHTEEFVRVSG